MKYYFTILQYLCKQKRENLLKVSIMHSIIISKSIKQ